MGIIIYDAVTETWLVTKIDNISIKRFSLAHGHLAQLRRLSLCAGRLHIARCKDIATESYRRLGHLKLPIKAD
jgi:hypothetical protein